MAYAALQNALGNREYVAARLGHISDETQLVLDRFGFEPEVVYALFQECARRNKLNSKAYIAKVAESWASRSIVTYADLNRYFLSYEQITRLGKKIGRKLRRTMT